MRMRMRVRTRMVTMTAKINMMTLAMCMSRKMLMTVMMGGSSPHPLCQGAEEMLTLDFSLHLRSTGVGVQGGRYRGEAAGQRSREGRPKLAPNPELNPKAWLCASARSPLRLGGGRVRNERPSSFPLLLVGCHNRRLLGLPSPVP